MNTKSYFRQFIQKRWWIVLVAVIITVIATGAFTFTQTPAYRATATFVVTPAVSFSNVSDFANGIDIVSRRPEIASTFAEIAVSNLIRGQATSALALSSDQTDSLSVNSKLRAGTNVLEISVESSDPQLAAAFANELGKQTVLYIQQLFEVYSLKALDVAMPADTPIRPKVAMNLLLGTLLGLVLGGGSIFVFGYRSDSPAN